MNNQYFIIGEDPIGHQPLEECLPAYRPGIVRRWLRRNLPDQGLILFPFGNSPQIALEAARAGYQSIIPVHNPILRFTLEILADPPPEDALIGALSKLASSYKGKNRLKPFILSLYETDCPLCGAKTSAEAYVWSRHANQPVEKVCRCKSCGEKSQSPVTTEDVLTAQKYRETSPVTARALTRVAAPNDPIRPQVETALASYPPRTVYALFSVLNKITGAKLPPDEIRLLEMLLLHAFYSTSPIRSTQEKSEETEDLFIEENVWLKLEDATGIWSGEENKVDVTTWPDLPVNGGVIIFPGRIRDLVSQINGDDIQALVLAFPQPAPSFWALSALWTGWFWGQEAAAPLRGILGIKNFDWAWMTRAVDLTLSSLYQVVPAGTRCFGLLPDLSRDFLISAISASRSAGFELNNILIDPDLRIGETSWVSSKGIFGKQTQPDIRELIRNAGYELLQQSGEPRDIHSLIAAGLFKTSGAGYPAPDLDAEDYFPQLRKDFEDNIAYRQGFLGFQEGLVWWHQDLDLSAAPLTDLLERQIVELLVNADGPLPETTIFEDVYQAFPGLLTPKQALILSCIKSYASSDNEKPRLWSLNPGEKPAQRRNDLTEIENSLKLLGEQMGFEISVEKTSGAIKHLIWLRNQVPAYSFLISASGLLGRILQEEGKTAPMRWMIMPGSRAGLVHDKLESNPLLSERVLSGWGLVKFRQIRRVVDAGSLTEDTFLEQLKLDPFQSDSPQLSLI